KKQGCYEIALLPSSDIIYFGIVRWTFHSTIPTAIIVGAVAIVFAICLIVFRVVADQVLQREAIMRGHKIYAGVGLAAAACIKVARSCNSISQLTNQAAITLPIRTHRVPIFIVPLRPANWEFSYLISALAQVPGLGNKLHLRQHRILMNDVEKRAQPVHLMQFT